MILVLLKALAFVVLPILTIIFYLKESKNIDKKDAKGSSKLLLAAFLKALLWTVVIAAVILLCLFFMMDLTYS